MRKTEGLEGAIDRDVWEDIAIDSSGTLLLLGGQNLHNTTMYDDGQHFCPELLCSVYDYDYDGVNHCSTSEFPVGVDWYQSESGDGDSSNEEVWRGADAVGDPYWWFSATALAITATPPGISDCMDSKNWFTKTSSPPPTTTSSTMTPTTTAATTTSPTITKRKTKSTVSAVSSTSTVSTPPTPTTAKSEPVSSSVSVKREYPSDYSPSLSPPYSPLSPSSPDESSQASSGCSSPSLYASSCEAAPPASSSSSSVSSKRRSRGKHSSSSSSSSSLSSSSSSLSSSSSSNNKTKQGGRTRGGHFPKETTDLLKQWLFAHTEHPYPTEEEKLLLAENTGLTVKQINYWFTNSRRRFLKKSGEL